MMSLTFGLFTQVRDSGPHGPLVYLWNGFIARYNMELTEKQKSYSPFKTENFQFVTAYMIKYRSL